jgi:hypothetical protein
MKNIANKKDITSVFVNVCKGPAPRGIYRKNKKIILNVELELNFNDTQGVIVELYYAETGRPTIVNSLEVKKCLGAKVVKAILNKALGNQKYFDELLTQGYAGF